jgi:hypothetical protein
MRSSRFAHIQMPSPISHPICGGEPLGAAPVLPAAFIENEGLAGMYEDLLDASLSGNCERCAAAFEQIADTLIPLAFRANRCELREAVTLARGMALEPHTVA